MGKTCACCGLPIRGRTPSEKGCVVPNPSKYPAGSFDYKMPGDGAVVVMKGCYKRVWGALSGSEALPSAEDPMQIDEEGDNAGLLGRGSTSISGGYIFPCCILTP